MNFVTREQWLTVPWLGGSPAFEANSVEHMTAHYAGGTLNLSNVPQLLNNMQTDYRVNRGYDLGYSYAIDDRGVVYEVRGMRVRAASDGAADTNRVTASAIYLCPTVDSPLTIEQVRAARELMAMVRERCPRALHWIGHRNVFNTACPGDVIYNRYVVTGVLEPGEKPTMPATIYVTDGSAVIVSNEPGVWYWITGAEFYGLRGKTLQDADVVQMSPDEFHQISGKAK